MTAKKRRLAYWWPWLGALAVIAAVALTFDGVIAGSSGSHESSNNNPKQSLFITITDTDTPTSTPTPTDMPCTAQTPFAEGFESGTLNTFTSQVVQCSTGGCGWNAVTTSQYSGAYSAFAPNVSSVSDQRMPLTTPVTIPLGVSSATLSFWHKHVFDEDMGILYDGSVLELSTDSGISWTDVLSSTNFISGGYIRSNKYFLFL